MSFTQKPSSDEHAAFYQNYIDSVPATDSVLTTLFNTHMDTIDLVTSLDDETLYGTYAPGKWSLMEVLVHLMDTERIFGYRALCFARNDKTELPGYNQDTYVPNSKANERKILNLVKEYSLLRASTIELFNSFDEEMCMRKGIANGNTMSVRAIAWIICGHEIHHRNIIEERYIGK